MYSHVKVRVYYKLYTKDYWERKHDVKDTLTDLAFHLHLVDKFAPLIKKGGNSKYIAQKNTPKKYQTKELFSYVLLF
jgi:hypothetical protein